MEHKTLEKLKNKEGGVSIFLSVVILTGVLAIALGVTSIVSRQIETSENISNSMKAVFAADAAIECKLLEIRKSIPCFLIMTNQTTFTPIMPNIICPPSNPSSLAYRGISRQIYRAIEICY